MTYARSIHAAALAAALVAVPGLAVGQGFVGAELSAELATLTEDRTFGSTSYGGGVEFSLVYGLSVGVDVSAHDWRGISGRSSAVTLHGIYELSPGTSVGVYWARESLPSDRATTYGLEGALALGDLDLAGHLGHYEADTVSGEFLGLSASYALGQAFALTGGVDAVNGDMDFTVASLGGEYRFASGPVVFGEVRQMSADDLSDTYLSIGARIELGQGTTFGSRGISDGRPVF